MACGQDRHWHCLQLILDGFIFQQTPFLSTMYSQNFRISLVLISILTLMILKDQCHTGCTKVLKVRHGDYHKQWQDGSDGMMEPMLGQPINLRLDGTLCQKEVQTITKVLHMASTHQSTCTITICTPRSMNSRGRREASKQLELDNSCQPDSFRQISEV